jgi:hypothetical protein
MKDSHDAATTKNQELGTKNSRRPAANSSFTIPPQAASGQ